MAPPRKHCVFLLVHTADLIPYRSQFYHRLWGHKSLRSGTIAEKPPVACPNPKSFCIGRLFSAVLYGCLTVTAIAHLETLCLKGLHLENPTDDSKHQWAPPNTTLGARTSDTRIYSAPSNKHPRYASTPRTTNGLVTSIRCVARSQFFLH